MRSEHIEIYPRSKQISGKIEATGPSFIKREGNGFLTEYSTVRLSSKNDQKIFLDNVSVGRHVDTCLSPGRSGVFYFYEVARQNSWLYAYQDLKGEIVHDLDGTYRSGLKSFWAAQFFLWIPLAWVLTADGYEIGFGGARISEAAAKLDVLIVSSPFIVIGLLCLFSYRAAQKRLKMLKGLLDTQDQATTGLN